MAVVAPSISNLASVGSCRSEQVQHFREQGCNPEVAQALYMALRLQEKGHCDQAVLYYEAVLRAQPDCTIAAMNFRLMSIATRPAVREVLSQAFEEEAAARRAAEAEEASRLAAEAAAEEERRRQEEVERAAEQQRQALAREEQERRQAQREAEEAEQRRQQERALHNKQRSERAYNFVKAKLEEQQARMQSRQANLEKQFPFMDLSSICINDVQEGNGGLICRSTHNSSALAVVGTGTSIHLHRAVCVILAMVMLRSHASIVEGTIGDVIAYGG